MVETKSRSCQRICCCCCTSRNEQTLPKAIYSKNVEVESTRLENECNYGSPKQKVQVPKCCRHECVCPPKQFRSHKPSPQGGDYIPLKYRSKQHYQSEIACHYKGEKYQNLVNKLKMYLDKLDDRPCLSDKPQPEKKKPLMTYPGYIDKKHPSNSPPSNKIPHVVGTRRIRATDDSQYEARFTDFCDSGLSRRKSKELIGGVIVKGCECIRRNGLQDQCPRTECGSKQKCVSTNPGPCCEPALAVLNRIENADEIRRQRRLVNWMKQNPKDATIFKEGSDKLQDSSSHEVCCCCCCSC